MANMKTLCLVTPDLYGSHGGIARITRVLCRAMGEEAERRGWKFVVHSLHDKRGTYPDQSVRMAYHPYASSRTRFAQAVLSTVHDRDTSAVVYTHVNHAPMSRLSRAPYFVVAHGVDVWMPLSAMRTEGLRRASGVWAVSDYTNRVVRGLHGVERTLTIHNCLALDVAMLSVARSSCSILLVSRLAGKTKGKRIDDAIRAFAHAQRHLGLEGWTLDIVGDGPLRTTYETLARESCVEGSVCFHRGISDDALKSLYQRCGFFSLPSVNEGFGLVFLEAMSFGKAVVAACAGASPEVVRDGVTGIITAPGDIEELASAYVRLARDEALRDALGGRGRLEVQRRFGYEAYRDAVARELGEVA
jgi:phosphatidylinositol alpha-1,6-mannosyltransferase